MVIHNLFSGLQKNSLQSKSKTSSYQCGLVTGSQYKRFPRSPLSVVDTLLSVLWISGAVVWLTGGLSGYNEPRVRCFSINCMTVVRSHFPQRHHRFLYLFPMYSVGCVVNNYCYIVLNFSQSFVSSKMQQILQCVSMNVTLIYALLAYFSSKQRALNGVYVSI